jgi:hypothetical protein
VTGFWRDFAVLYVAALVGAIALAPFSVRLIQQSQRPLKASPRTLMLAAFAQNMVLFAVVVAVGLVAAGAVGVGGLGRMSAPALAWALGLGGAAGLALLVADLALLPRIPALLELARKSSLLESFLASFYGGANEELLTRLLGVSAVAWLVWQPWRAWAARPADWMFWTAIGVMALVFALGHLPATRLVAGRLTPLVVARALGLNIPVAILCGWLFWRFGIVAAMLAHFATDIVYHVGGTALLRASDRRGLFRWIPPPRASPAG